MRDTIDLLEVVGRDASLRHASGEHLVRVLEGMQATEALKQAARSASGSPLTEELGPRNVQVTHTPVQTVPNEEEEDGLPVEEDEER